MMYPDLMIPNKYYTAEELSTWERRYWLEEHPSWVVVLLADGRLACVVNADIAHAMGEE